MRTIGIVLGIVGLLVLLMVVVSAVGLWSDVEWALNASSALGA